MKGKGLMFQGTASSVGKSILVTAMCRIFTQDGYNVNPFKSQNMSLNSYITPEGHEMGRAQVMQAEASKKVPNVSMNPILLKPTSDRKSQVIYKGKVHKTMDAVDYFKYKPKLKKEIKEVYDDLAQESDVVVIEGAGSPAEINLKADDIVNMGMAEMADAPVILIGDIDRGGVFASLYGTIMLLDEDERKRVKGVVINKFRGSVEILEPGLRQLEELINIPVLGVIPYFRLDLEEEDGVFEPERFNRNKTGDLDVAVIRLPYMSNFTDFNALALHPDVNLRFVELNQELGNPDIVILPGSKTTIHDLEKLREFKMDEKIMKAYEGGSFIFGVCGGYQMLGKEIHDPHHFESSREYTVGLGLLDIVTTFNEEKTTTRSEGIDNWFGESIKGYEIHMGLTEVGESATKLIKVEQQNDKEVSFADGVVSKDKRVVGTYFHGIFDNGNFTRKYLNYVRKQKGKEEIKEQIKDYWQYKDEQYDKLADIVRENIDMKKIYEILKK